ncbi:MAG: tetratricopeptide repeat protein [Alloprevotella sp.]|nr:tetratricopeptide repeat protein [Alloprevotella sp.]
MKEISLFLLLTLSCILHAQAGNDKATADQAYQHKNYVEAVRSYEACLKQDEKSHTLTDKQRADLQYNLGNAYYRQQRFAHAVLAYRRALQLNPAHTDAAFNLQLTTTKLTDHFDAPSEMFFVSCTKRFIYSQSAATWGICALLALIVTLSVGMCCLFPWKLWLRRTALTVACLAGSCAIAFECFAHLQKNRLTDNRLAVVMQTTIVRNSPSATAKEIRELHEGTTVTVKEIFKDQWLQVQLPDGTEAYVTKEKLAFV